MTDTVAATVAVLPFPEWFEQSASVLFLLAAVVGATFTVNAFRPSRATVPLIPSFFAVWITNELAPWHMIWQLVATLVFVAAGALDHWPGWVAMGITVVSWGGLGILMNRSYRTSEICEAALVQALGADYREQCDPALAQHFTDRISWLRIALPFWFRNRHVRRVRNLDYWGDGSRRHRCDLFLPKDESLLGPAPGRAGAPVLLQIHGGAWMISNKDQQGRPLLYHLAQRGWICVAINYRLAPKYRWPSQLVDCKRALAWIREHIAEHGGDPDLVVVSGGSAGGHLTAMMGLTHGDPQWQPGFEDADTRPQAFVPFYGVYDFVNRDGLMTRAEARNMAILLNTWVMPVRYRLDAAPWDSASPMTHVNADAPPCFLLHGDADNLAPVRVARRFAARLRDVSREPVAYAELKGSSHAFDVFNSVRSFQAVWAVERFAAWVVGRERARITATGDAAAAAPGPAADGPTTTARTEPPRAPRARSASGRS